MATQQDKQQTKSLLPPSEESYEKQQRKQRRLAKRKNPKRAMCTKSFSLEFPSISCAWPMTSTREPPHAVRAHPGPVTCTRILCVSARVTSKPRSAAHMYCGLATCSPLRCCVLSQPSIGCVLGLASTLPGKFPCCCHTQFQAASADHILQAGVTRNCRTGRWRHSSCKQVY